MALKKKLQRLYDFLFRNERVREQFYEIIFKTDTPMGKLFEVVLIWFIIMSVFIVIVETVEMPEVGKTVLEVFEWMFTIFFTAELFMRLYCIDNKREYLLSPFGIIDILSILPSYLAIIFPEAHALMVIRIIRIIRVFKVYKLVTYMSEGMIMVNAIRASARKIIVFAVFVLLLVTVIGALLYAVEGNEEESSFSSIPQSIYWAVVTLTTVGYGDIAPVTPLGRFLTMIVMLLGYTILSVPTGVFSVSLLNEKNKTSRWKVCPDCGRRGHDEDAVYCSNCGAELCEKKK